MILNLRKTGAFFVLIFFILSNIPVATLYAETKKNERAELAETAIAASWSTSDHALADNDSSEQTSPVTSDNASDSVRTDNTDNESAILSELSIAEIIASENIVALASTGTTSSGTTMSGSTSSGNVLAPVIDYSTYKYYSGTFMRDGKTYGNSLYSDDMGFSDMKDKKVQVKTYSEHMAQPKGKRSAETASTPTMMSAPSSGLVGEWHMNGNANDSSGNGYDGTIVGWEIVADRFGSASSAYAFTSAASRMFTSASVSQSSDYSVAMDVKASSYGNQTIFYWGPNSVDGTAFHDFVDWTGGNIRLYRNAWVSYPFAADARWHRFVFTFGSAGTGKIYKDGVLVASGNIGTSGQNMKPVFFGRSNGSTRSISWDSVRLYNRILSDSDIQDLHSEGMGFWPAGSWDLNGNSNDTSGYGNDGTATNVAWTTGKFLQGASFSNGFDARTSHISVPAITSDDLTISFWSSTTEPTSHWYMLPVDYESAWAIDYRILFWDSSWTPNRVWFQTWPSTVVSGANSLLRDGTFQHWTFVRKFNGASYNLAIYLNSVLVGSGSSPTKPTPTGTSTSIWSNSFAGWGFNGKLDSVRIHKRALSLSEIQALYGESSSAVSNATYSSVPTSTTNQVLANLLSKYDFTDPSSCMVASNDKQATTAATSEKETGNKGDPVTLSKGEFTYDNTLMSIPGKKIPFEFKLSYKNQVYYNGPAGINWDHNYNMNLTMEANGNVLYRNGRLGAFRFIKSGSVFGYNEGLKANLALSGGTYVIAYDNGDKHAFNAAQRISRIEDANGNHIDFAYAGELLSTVTDTLGRVINYTYFEHNRLKEVTDFSGRKVKLNYFTGMTASGSIHDLQSVAIDNGSGAVKSIGFEYTTGDDTTGHNITKLIDSKSQTYVVNAYDAGDRVASQKYGSGTIGYTYVLSGNAIAKNTVLDRLGNKTEYNYDANGNQTLVKYFNEAQTGSLDYSYEYDANGFLSKETKPRGNGFAYSYDAKWNLLEKRMKTDMSAANSWSDLVTTATYNAGGQVLTETRPNGIVMTNVFDASGNIVSKTTSGIKSHSGAVSSSASTFSYLAGGFLDSMADGEGNTTKFQYGSGQISKIVRGTGSATSTGSFTYDAYGNATVSTDGAWWAKYAAYDAFGLLSTGTTAEGIATSYGYDANNNRISESRYLSGWVVAKSKFFYDLLDNMTGSLIDTASGKALLTTLKYDDNANVIERKIGSGALAKYRYNEFGKIREERIVMNPNDVTKDIVTAYAYDQNGNLIRKTDPLGNVHVYAYDLFDRLSRETDPKGAYVLYAHDRDGSVNSRSAYNSGNVILSKSAYLYDGLGNAVKTIDYLDPAGSSGGAETTTTYDRNGRKKTVNDPLGNTTANSYDSLGRLIATTDALGNAATYAYDKRDLAISKSIVPNTGTGIVTTTSAFDKDGRLVGETDNLGQTKTLAYDALGHVVRSQDEAGNATEYELDYAGKTTRETEYLSGTSVTTKYAYDERGNLLAVTDPKWNETMYAYDGLNRNTDVIHADGKGLSYTYDKSSNLVSQTDPNGTVTTNSYDTTGLLLGRAIATGTGVAGIVSEVYVYDSVGRVISWTDSSANKIEFAYDALGRLLSESNSGTVVANAYDPNGNLAKIVYPDGRESTYTYDSLNRVTGISFSGASVATYAYTGIVNTGISYSNGTAANQTYDQLMRLKSLSSGANAYAYSYDAAGNIVADGYRSYAYDTMHRLVGASWSTLESFAYDKAGNRTSDANSAYTTNALNQYTSSTGATSASYAYDGNGNVTSNGVFAFQYDYKNRLVKVSSGSTVVSSYKYDVLGRRIEKTVGGAVTKYTYAGKNILAEARTENGATFRKTYINGLGTDDLIAYDIEEADLTSAEMEELEFCNDQVLSATGRFLKYGYASIVDRCDALSASGASVVVNRYYFHKNHLGSVVGLTDSAGAVVAQYDYDAYGNAYVKTGSGAFEKIDSATALPHDNARLFTAREYDGETGLYYLRARYYDSITGRFISRDPIGQLDDLNLYGYVGNSPMMWTDPDGTVKLAIARAAASYRAFLQSESESDNYFDAFWAGVSQAAIGDQLAYLESLGQISNGEMAVRWWVNVAFALPILRNIKQGAEAAQLAGGIAKKWIKAIEKKAEKTYQTYTKVWPNGEIYTGRTSGYNNPKANVRNRDMNHHMNEKWYKPANLETTSTDPKVVRAREQQLIDQFGWAQSKGGTSGNAINWISPNNPKRDTYFNALVNFFAN